MTDKIARALFIGEKLFKIPIIKKGSDTVCWHAPGTLYNKRYDGADIRNWLESPDGLKAVRDALVVKIRITLTQWESASGKGYICFLMTYRAEDTRMYRSQETTEAEAILTATEAFLRDE